MVGREGLTSPALSLPGPGKMLSLLLFLNCEDYQNCQYGAKKFGLRPYKIGWGRLRTSAVVLLSQLPLFSSGPKL